MIAVDTNVLVYAHRRDSGFHMEAAGAVRALAEGRAPWGIPWPCIHEFLAIVTHPRVFRPPSEIGVALDQVAAWLESPSVVLLAEGPGYADRLREVITASKVSGARIHDARVATVCLHHGVQVLWSADRDFSRFAGLAAENPLTG